MDRTTTASEGQGAALQSAFVELHRTHDYLMTAFGELFARYGVTEPQYNVLRILRGAGAPGLPCRTVGERMLTRVPDVTRLLDRLEGAGLVSRERGLEDRRVVLTRLTDRGASLLRRLDGPLRELHRRQFAGLSERELQRLARLLRRVRGEDGRRQRDTEEES